MSRVKVYIEPKTKRLWGKGCTKVWTTKSGKDIKIGDMSDRHLLNTINLIDKTVKQMEIEETQELCDALGFLKGEMAVIHAENGLNFITEHGIEPSLVEPLYDDLLDEATARGLNLKED